jgi:hypothetical protein
MKTSLLRFVWLALPELCALACGTTGPSGPPDQGQGSCPAGVIVHRITDGTYSPVPGSGMIVMDTCQTMLTGASVEKSRQLTTDLQTGSLELFENQGQTILGAGPLRCNSGTLTYSPMPARYVDGTLCHYALSTSVALTVTSDTTFDIQVTETRSDSSSEPGMACPQPPTCTLIYKVSQKM